MCDREASCCAGCVRPIQSTGAWRSVCMSSCSSQDSQHLLFNRRHRDEQRRCSMLKKIGVGLAVLGAVAIGVYLRFIRPWQLRWGATDEEVARAMPGDDVVKQPTFNATRAVTIQARPEEIWPWLVQIGVTRAGWYSYDWLDNLGKPSAQRLLPQFQQVAVGDL